MLVFSSSYIWLTSFIKTRISRAEVLLHFLEMKKNTFFVFIPIIRWNCLFLCMQNSSKKFCKQILDDFSLYMHTVSPLAWVALSVTIPWYVGVDWALSEQGGSTEWTTPIPFPCKNPTPMDKYEMCFGVFGFLRDSLFLRKEEILTPVLAYSLTK